MKTKWVLIGLAAALAYIAIALTIGGVFSWVMMRNETKVTGDSWLLLDVTGQVVEYNRFEDDFLFNEANPSAHDIVKAIRGAAEDDNIVGIIITPHIGAVSGVSLQRIGDALDEFRATGKPIEAWMSSGQQKDYWLASYAHRIHMLPSESAALIFTGVGGSAMFYTEALERIGVKVHVSRIGDSKGAGETFERTSFSEPFKRNLRRVYDSYYEQMLQAIADRRYDGDIEPVHWLYEERESFFVTPSQALEWGLIDALTYPDEFYEDLEITEDQLVSWSEYHPATQVGFGDAVAVVYAQGAITGQTGRFGVSQITYKDIDRTLDRIESDESVKALVLRVDSPGGSALVSEEIHQRISRLKQTMPVVVSMAGVAASGGYYISCEADSIYAEPMSIVGSIGVVSMIPNLSGLADKVGLHTDGVSRGKFSGVFNVWRPLDKRLTGSLHAHGVSVYEEFKQRVADGRNMTLDEVEDVAQGKVYTGQQAMDIGLVDRIGDLDDAIECAAGMAGLSHYRVRWAPERSSMFEDMLREGLKLNDRMRSQRMKSLPTDVQMAAQMLREEGVLLLSPIMPDAVWDAPADAWIEEKLLD